ncbi:MAG: copper amine oxidase N-terminal domain-containing protein, partial [Caldisericia bacterium]|nr:copper amine oxidase N-terminal domain-containing protein [Caldisericia bacterium]
SPQEKVEILFDGKPIRRGLGKTWDESFGWFTKGEKKQSTLTFINHSNEDISFTISPKSTEEVFAVPSQFTLKANETSFCNLIFQLKDKEKSNNYYEYVKIHSLEQDLNLQVNYWFQTDFRQITIWKNKENYEDIDKNVKRTLDYFLPPMIINDRMYIAARFYQELGYSIQLHFQKNFAATLRIDGNTLYFESLSDKIIINGEPVYPENRLDIIHEGRMFLPLRFLAEYAGYTVTWDPSEEKVTLLYEVKE